MVLKLYGWLVSPCTQTVVMTLKELGVPFELIPIVLSNREQKKEQFLTTKQPFGQIPVLACLFLRIETERTTDTFHINVHLG